MIIVSGFKVFPNQVEDAVALHPGVAEVGAIGVPDERSGEVVKIVVVRQDPALTEQALLEHCRKLLTGYKVPRIVEFSADRSVRNSLPLPPPDLCGQPCRGPTSTSPSLLNDLEACLFAVCSTAAAGGIRGGTRLTWGGIRRHEEACSAYFH